MISVVALEDQAASIVPIASISTTKRDVEDSLAPLPGAVEWAVEDVEEEEAEAAMSMSAKAGLYEIRKWVVDGGCCGSVGAAFGTEHCSEIFGHKLGMWAKAIEGLGPCCQATTSVVAQATTSIVVTPVEAETRGELRDLLASHPSEVTFVVVACGGNLGAEAVRNRTMANTLLAAVLLLCCLGGHRNQVGV